MGILLRVIAVSSIVMGSAYGSLQGYYLLQNMLDGIVDYSYNNPELMNGSSVLSASDQQDLKDVRAKYYQSEERR